MAEHTPTPWAHEGGEIVTAYSGPRGKVIAIAAHGTVSSAPPLRVGDDDWDLGMANLSFAVRAANAHDDAQRAIAYLVADGIVNGDKCYPQEIAEWARDLILNEERSGIELIRSAIALARKEIK